VKRSWYPALLAIGLTTVACAGRTAELTLATPAGYQGADRTQIVPQVLTFDPRFARLRVLSVPFETQVNESTLHDLTQHLVNRKELRKRDWAVMNGGLSSFRTDVPLGLLVVDGKALGTLSREKASTGNAAPWPSDFGAFRWSGILCQLAAGDAWQIVASSRYKPGQCRQAIQSGPTLVEPGGRVGISDDEPDRSRPFIRSAVCLLPDGRMRFVIAPQPTHLLPFARWLAQPEPGGGGCDAALNLSGDSSSGMYLHTGQARAAGVPIGPASFPLPSALLVQSTR
jgi:uncharacterized protein YigE (DUF2233 family)